MKLTQTIFLSNKYRMNTDMQHVDYKDVEVLKQYINPYGRILPQRRTNLTSKQQRAITNAIKRARFMGLLPYVQK